MNIDNVMMGNPVSTRGSIAASNFTVSLVIDGHDEV